MATPISAEEVDAGPPCIELLDLSVEAPVDFSEPLNNTSGGEGTLAASASTPLVHRLMENVNAPKELDRVYDRDYLSRRCRAFGNDSTDPWKGANDFEKNLVSCLDEDGALRRDSMLQFLGCFGDEESDDWALPFAILERTQHEDEEDARRAAKTEEKLATKTPIEEEEKKRGKRKRSTDGDDDDSDYASDDVAEDEDEDDWEKSEEEDMDSSSSSHGSASGAAIKSSRNLKKSVDLKAVAEMSPEVVKVQKPQPMVPRMELFLHYGGLRLMSRWLRFATKPKKQAGSLMLPLLKLITKVPFNFQAIEQSQINKVRTLITVCWLCSTLSDFYLKQF